MGTAGDYHLHYGAPGSGFTNLGADGHDEIKTGGITDALFDIASDDTL